MEKEYLTIKEAAKKIGVTPLTLRNWDKSGKFPATRHPMNNYRVYKKEQVDKLLDEIKSGKVSYVRKKKPSKKRLRVRSLE